DKMRNGNYNGNGERWYDYDGQTGHYSFGSQGQAFGYGVSYMNSYGSWGMHPGWAGSTRKALGRYGRYTGSYGLTDDMWNGYMQFQWSGYAYDVNTRVGNKNTGFNTTGWLYGSEGIVVSYYSTARAEALFFGSNQGQGSGGGMTDFSNANHALTFGGGIYGALEGLSASQGYWLGKNGKYYSTN